MLKTVLVKISKLKFAEYNPREISKPDFESLKLSLKEFGVVEDIVVNKDDTIIGGHMRVRAAKAIGLEDIPVKYVDLSINKAKALNLALNRIHGDWDKDKLDELLYELDQIPDFDMQLTGFSQDEIDQMKDRVAPVEEDEAPELPEEAESKLGEVYTLGRHRLMCGDATKIEDVEKLMDGKKENLLYTDPPYGINLDSSWLSKIYLAKGTPKNKSDAVMINDQGELDCSFLFNYEKKIIFGFPHIFDHTSTGWLVWDKQPGVKEKIITSPVEMASTNLWRGFDIIRLMWGGYFKEDRKENKVGHPTQKPLRLFSHYIKKYTKQNDIVLDLFGGSGSTLIAAEQTNRICYMMELDPKYVDVIRKRYDNFTKSN